MDATVYQKLAARTINPNICQSIKEGDLIDVAMGLSGETGEVVDLIKKHLFQGHPLSREKMLEEAGDVAWYLAYLCTALKADMSEVFEGNIRKLMLRYPEGFTELASMERVDMVEGQDGKM